MNKTATFEVGSMLSPRSAYGVERQLASMPGVESASVNSAGESASVTFDDARVSPEQIVAAIENCGFHCRGELQPHHVCAAPEPTSPHAHGHAAHGPRPGEERPLSSGTEEAAPPLPSTTHAHSHAASGDMMHDMGHAPGMSMQDMVRDVRNRFLVAPRVCGSCVPLLADGFDVR